MVKLRIFPAVGDSFDSIVSLGDYATKLHIGSQLVESVILKKQLLDDETWGVYLRLTYAIQYTERKEQINHFFPRLSGTVVLSAEWFRGDEFGEIDFDSVVSEDKLVDLLELYLEKESVEASISAMMGTGPVAHYLQVIGLIDNIHLHQI